MIKIGSDSISCASCSEGICKSNLFHVDFSTESIFLSYHILGIYKNLISPDNLPLCHVHLELTNEFKIMKMRTGSVIT